MFTVLPSHTCESYKLPWQWSWFWCIMSFKVFPQHSIGMCSWKLYNYFLTSSWKHFDWHTPKLFCGDGKLYNFAHVIGKHCQYIVFHCYKLNELNVTNCEMKVKILGLGKEYDPQIGVGRLLANITSLSYRYPTDHLMSPFFAWKPPTAYYNDNKDIV